MLSLLPLSWAKLAIGFALLSALKLSSLKHQLVLLQHAMTTIPLQLFLCCSSFNHRSSNVQISLGSLHACSDSACKPFLSALICLSAKHRAGEAIFTTCQFIAATMHVVLHVCVCSYQLLPVQWTSWSRLECSTLCFGQQSSQDLSWSQTTLGMSLLRLFKTHPQVSLRFA